MPAEVNGFTWLYCPEHLAALRQGQPSLSGPQPPPDELRLPQQGEQWKKALDAAKDNLSKIPQQVALMAIALDNYRLVRDMAGELFAVDRHRAPGIAIPLKGKGGLRQRLSADLLMLTSRTASNEALSMVMGASEGLASQAERTRTYLRTARLDDGRIALDLGRDDGLAVLCGPGGWELSTRSTVLFRRSAAIPALPVPVSGGIPDGVLSLVNLWGSDELALYIGCRLMSLMPEGTRPVELITGQPGAIKTGTTRVTVSWLGGHMTAMPRDPRDWAAIASNATILGHDNVSRISEDRQDLICRAASGGEHSGRALYSDAELFAVKFQPVTVVINGVEVGIIRSDLIRRMVAHYLIKPGWYLTDAEVTSRWATVHGAALGWLCGLLCQVLERMPLVPQPRGDSLSDFAWVLAALDSLWGTHALELWRNGQGRLYRDLAESDPVALAVMAAISGAWEGSAKDLLERLERAHTLPPPGPGQRWTPQRLSGALDRCTAALEAFGWKIGRREDTHAKSRRIMITPGETVLPAGPQTPGAVILPYHSERPDGR